MRSLDDATPEEWASLTRQTTAALAEAQKLEEERARKIKSGEVRLAPIMPGLVRSFETGATRSAETGKPDYEGYLSPRVLKRFGEYMTKHRVQADGSLRASDNWQRGIPLDSYVKSAWRHFMDVWSEHRGIKTTEGLEDALCALLFNVQGYLHEHLKAKEVP